MRVRCDHECVEDAGPRAPWLTLVHGASQHRGLFSAQVAAFRERYRILLVDLPGHGGSSAMDGPYGQLEYAEAVGPVIEQVGAGAGHYWGTHTGAAVGLLLRCRARMPFRSLVLEGVVMPGEALESVTRAYAQASETARAHGMRRARAEWLEGEFFAALQAEPERCRAAAYRQLTEEFEGRPWTDLRPPRPATPLWSELAGIDQPVLLVNGEHDAADFRALAVRVGAALPRARGALVEHASGFPLWEFPEPVNALVGAFLQEADAAAR